MSGGCGELPPLICLEDCDGNWGKYINKVFAVFYRDFIESQPKYNNKWVRCRREPIFQGKEAGFWHCTSTGDQEDQRKPDLRRCERIGWIRFAIENCLDVNVDCWTNERHGEVHHLVWLREELLVVLAERRRERDGFEYYQLITAYIPEESYKVKLRKERDRSRNG